MALPPCYRCCGHALVKRKLRANTAGNVAAQQGVPCSCVLAPVPVVRRCCTRPPPAWPQHTATPWASLARTAFLTPPSVLGGEQGAYQVNLIVGGYGEETDEHPGPQLYFMDYLAAMARVRLFCCVFGIFGYRCCCTIVHNTLFVAKSQLTPRRKMCTHGYLGQLVLKMPHKLCCHVLQVPFAAQGYGGFFTLSLMDKHYKPGMNQDEAIDLLKRCIKEVGCDCIRV